MFRAAFHAGIHLPVVAARQMAAGPHPQASTGRALQFCLAKSPAVGCPPVVAAPAALSLPRQLLPPKFPAQIACPLPSLVVSFSPSSQRESTPSTVRPFRRSHKPLFLLKLRD